MEFIIFINELDKKYMEEVYTQMEGVSRRMGKSKTWQRVNWIR